MSYRIPKSLLCRQCGGLRSPQARRCGRCANFNTREIHKGQLHGAVIEELIRGEKTGQYRMLAGGIWTIGEHTLALNSGDAHGN